MTAHLYQFVLHWGIMSVSLWVASLLFRGMTFTSGPALLVSALALGFFNAILRPVLIALTLPLTLLSFGLFLLVINALLLQLVAVLVKGFELKGFWTAFFVSIFVSAFGFLIELYLPGNGPHLIPTHGPTLSV